MDLAGIIQPVPRIAGPTPAIHGLHLLLRDALVEDRPGPLQGHLPGRFQDVRQRLGGPHQTRHDVQGLDQPLVEQIQMPYDRLASGLAPR